MRFNNCTTSWTYLQAPEKKPYTILNAITGPTLCRWNIANTIPPQMSDTGTMTLKWPIESASKLGKVRPGTPAAFKIASCGSVRRKYAMRSELD